MRRQPLRQKLIHYRERFQDERRTVEKVIAFLDAYENCFDRHNWDGHFTGSAWVVDKARSAVLMTHHRKLNKWLQLGGHADGYSDLLQVAVIEAQEESGLKQFKALSENIFDLDIHLIPAHGKDPEHYHYDVRFILETDHDSKDLIVSDESHAVAWVKRAEVLPLNPEESMMRMLEKTTVKSWM